MFWVIDNQNQFSLNGDDNDDENIDNDNEHLNDGYDEIVMQGINR